LEVENRDDSNGKDLKGIEFKKRLYSITDMVSEIGAIMFVRKAMEKEQFKTITYFITLYERKMCNDKYFG
jgi:hypothetical protein